MALKYHYDFSHIMDHAPSTSEHINMEIVKQSYIICGTFFQVKYLEH